MTRWGKAAGGAMGTARLAVAGLLAGLGLAGPLVEAPSARADDSMISVESLRTGWDGNEPGLAPAQVSSSDFGRQFSTAVDGQVFAQPVVAGPTVIVATENDKVYGIAAAGGAVRWHRSLGAPWPAAAIGCGDLTPNIGVTSTPVYDAGSGTVYLTAKVNDGSSAAHPHWYMHALDAQTGKERTGWPVTIGGAASNAPAVTFNPFTAAQRPGLLLMGGAVYAGFASHCDHGPYNGWVVRVDAATRRLKLWTSESSPAGGGGVWQSGGGLVSDGPGRILLSTGNGISPAPGPGSRPPGTLSESVVRLKVSADGTMSAHDFFAPANAPTLDHNDQDLGSGGPTGLPDSFGTARHPHVLVQVGKDGRVFLLDRDQLGGDKQAPGGHDAAVAVTGPYGGVWGHPGVWGGDGGYVYTTEANGFLRAFKRGVNSAGAPTLSNTGTSTSTFKYGSGSPVVTSTGTTSGSALVWVVALNGNNAQLRAYDPVPVNRVLRLRWSAPIGAASKFEVPATDSGRVFVGTRDGHLIAFGRPTTSALVAQPVDFGLIPVGHTTSSTLQVTASRTVTISAIATTPPFAATPPGLPLTLHSGQSLNVPVSFAPTTPGAASSAVSFTTDAGTIGVDLHGIGTQEGLGANPTSLDFGTLGTGTSKTLTVNIVNTGTSAETVTGTTAPTGPFTASGLPAAGTVVAAQSSLSVAVTYAPALASSADSSSLTVTGSGGQVIVPLSGTAVTGRGKLTLTPTSTDFGQVPVGQTVSKAFDISNTGNIQLTITKAKAPTAPFSTTTPVAEGQVLNPGEVIHQTMDFTPTATGPATAAYQITADDGQGIQHETLTGTGVLPGNAVAVPPPSAGGWTFNGSAALAGDDLRLTPVAANSTGSAFFTKAVPSAKLHAHFTVVIGGGTGADGMTFAILDSTAAKPTALGVGGGGLGYSGLPGIAVTLDTHMNGNDPSSNFVGLATEGVGDTLSYAATSTAIGNLRTGAHTVDVTISPDGHVMVKVDEVQVIDAPVTLPPNVLVGFTGAAGGLTDAHTARAVTISY